MSHEIDKRGMLQDRPFSYVITRDSKVFIYWQGKHVSTLKGDNAQKFMASIDALEPHAAQLAMAKITGNFKRGNER